MSQVPESNFEMRNGVWFQRKLAEPAEEPKDGAIPRRRRCLCVYSLYTILYPYMVPYVYRPPLYPTTRRDML